MTASAWDWRDMPDQSGRTVVITGANSGIGYAATAAFVRKGAEVIMACRSLDRGRTAREEIVEATGAQSVTVMELDLADLDSVHTFAEAVANDAGVDVLCNNAGVMAIPRSETADGFERQFGVNHLGHFALTGLLLSDLAESSSDPRVVTVSSGVHERGRIDFDDLQSEADYSRFGAYAQSKLANVLFAYELDRRLEAADLGVTSTACHPGWAATNLQRRGPEQAGSTLRRWAMAVANRLFAQSPERGALPVLYAATAPDIEGGEYVGPGGFMNMRGAPERQSSSERSYDREVARRLWTVSAELTGVTFDLPPVAADVERAAT